MRLHGEHDTLEHNPSLTDVGRAPEREKVRGRLTQEQAPLRRAGDAIAAARRRQKHEAGAEPLPALTPEQAVREREIRDHLRSLTPVDREVKIRAAYQAGDWETIASVRRSPAVLGELVDPAVLEQARQARIAASPVSGDLATLDNEAAIVASLTDALEAFGATLTPAAGPTSETV